MKINKDFFKKFPSLRLPRGTKVTFMYRSNEFINLVSVGKNSVTFFLWDGISKNPSYVMKFPRYEFKNV